MTWSIVAHDPNPGAFAVAVATKAFAVGASCPFVRAGVGAVSTQSMTNRYLAPAILDAHGARTAARGGDRGCAGRRRRAAASARSTPWTGTAAPPPGPAATASNGAAACRAGGISVAGNMLAGEPTVASHARILANNPDLPMPERLMAAMEAGEAAGGDRRGRQSAAMSLVTTEDFPDLDLRVDDHGEPLAGAPPAAGDLEGKVPGAGVAPRKPIRPA